MNSAAIKSLQAALQQAKTAVAIPPKEQTKQLTEAEIAEKLRTTELQNIQGRKTEQIQEQTQEESEDILKGNIKTSLESIINNMQNKDLVSKDFRYILSTLQKHPTLKQILLPEDVGVMVKAIQVCHSSQIKKAQATSSKKRAQDQTVNEISDMLSGMGIT